MERDIFPGFNHKELFEVKNFGELYKLLNFL
jgi:hypothetical protein